MKRVLELLIKHIFSVSITSSSRGDP